MTWVTLIRRCIRAEYFFSVFLRGSSFRLKRGILCLIVLNSLETHLTRVVITSFYPEHFVPHLSCPILKELGRSLIHHNQADTDTEAV